ncbi:Protein FLOWERING LOCUS D, partial [Penicillium rolfsii]
PPPSINDRGLPNFALARAHERRPKIRSGGVIHHMTGIRYACKTLLRQITTGTNSLRHAMSAKPHVGIIGAGFSGLRCADILIQNGARVTILEARGRIGGRVHQEAVGGHLVDLGPNWIHGTGKNPITSIADATQTITHDPEGQNISISRDGQLLSEDVVTKAEEFMWTTIEQAFQYSKRHGDKIPPERSLYDFFKEKVEQTAFSEEEKQLCLDSCKLWGAYVGDPIERQSLKFFCLEECIDGDNHFVASTYKRILDYVSRDVLTQADIRLKQAVVSINAPPRSDGRSKHQITVATATGESYSFDEVVVTCPLGWLKQNTEAFSPPLPDRLLEAIHGISYGRLEKVYVTFPQAFWHTSSTDAGQHAGSAAILRNPVFAQFLDPFYAKHPDNLEWNQECLSLAAMPPPYNHSTLLFYTYGPCSTYIVEQIASLDPNSSEYYKILVDFFEPFYSRLPGYDIASPDCIPTAVMATRWQSDPYAGNGSYCNFQVGLTRADEDVEVLRSGAGVGSERGLWFAGEHTAPFEAMGTTTGAYLSGERIAVQVCESLGLGKE